MGSEVGSRASASGENRHRPQIRTFHPRRSRMTPRQRRAFESDSQTVAEFLDAARPPQPETSPDMARAISKHKSLDKSADTSRDTSRAFGSTPATHEVALIGRRELLRAGFSGPTGHEVRRIALEIGFGMGDATVAMAAGDRSTGIIAVDVHTPGAGALLAAVAEQQLHNVRVLDGDALELLPELGANSLDEVRIYFPDPWPKRRHAKRRLVSPDFAASCARVLSSGGVLHLATDWEPYAEMAAEVLADSPAFPVVRVGDDPALRRGRPVTRYERTGLNAGRRITEIVAARA